MLALVPPIEEQANTIFWSSLDSIATFYDRETKAMISLARALRISKVQRQHQHKDEVEIRETPKRRMWEE